MIEIFVDSCDSEGRGVGRDSENRVIFIENALPKSRVRARVYDERKSFALAECVEIIEESPHKTQARCEHFSKCGGCTWQELAYDAQVHYKQDIVRNAFEKIAKQAIEIPYVINKATQLSSFRNKMEFAFGYDIKNRKTVLGLHKKKSHEIISVNCALCDENVNVVISRLEELVNEYNLPVFRNKNDRVEGFLRHAVTRVTHGREDTQLFVLEVITAQSNKYAEALHEIFERLYEEFQFITGMIHSVRRNNFSLAYGEKTYATFGRPYLEEVVHVNTNPLRLQHSHQSFFQVNTSMTSLLLSRMADFLHDIEINSLADIYCGVGGMGIALAKTKQSEGKETQVFGLETMPKAIEFARKNAQINLVNAGYYVGNAKDLEPFLKKCGTLDLVLLDPPRAGIDKETMQVLRQALIPHILIVSCDPASLARDVLRLNDSYVLDKIESFDFFPHTAHIETLALLKRK